MALRVFLMMLIIPEVFYQTYSNELLANHNYYAFAGNEAVHSIHKRDTSSPCFEDTFLKGSYCVSDCGDGLYGNTKTRTCEKCAKQCRSCFNAEVNSKCSGCSPPFYLQGTKCVTSCAGGWSKTHVIPIVRLVGGQNRFEGRVEVLHNGEWGTVCDDLWDWNAANVVCRELMLGEATEAVTSGLLGRGKPSQTIWLDDVKCFGNESRLEQCRHREWGKHDCGHFEDAGVRCSGPSSTRVCTSDCGEGYYMIPSRTKYGSKGTCGACSPSCLACENVPTNCTKCDSSSFLSDGFLNLGCFRDTSNRAIPTLEGQHVRLDGSYTTRANAIRKCAAVARSLGYQVFAIQNGGWCASSSDAQNTYKKYGKSTSCRDGGRGGPWANQVYTFKGAKSKCVPFCGDGFYGDLTDQTCKPCNPSCRTCKDSPNTCIGCYDNKYLLGSRCVSTCGPATVGMKRQVRLAGIGRGAYSGRVEIRVAHSWRTVCDRTWDLRDAQVVCRWLGMGTALEAVSRARFGQGRGSVFNEILNCTGTEATLFDCPRRTLVWSRCYHVNDAGVICSGPQTGMSQSNLCMSQCPKGWYKTYYNQCQKCTTSCADCVNSAYRCIECKAPNFRKGKMCVRSCGTGLYGNTKTRECSKCSLKKCESCADGESSENCTSCAAPGALKNGDCVLECGPDLFKLGGKCVSDCGKGYYKFSGNYSCLVCPSSCNDCKYKGKGLTCSVCRPPKAMEGGKCVVNCTGAKVAVPTFQQTSGVWQSIRLVNGSDYLEGLLEVKHNGVWGTVCDDSWGYDDKFVVCRQLNLGNPSRSLKRTDIPSGTGKIWLDDVHCTRNNKRLEDCRHRGWGINNCNHREDVKMRCSGPGTRECMDKCPPGYYSDGTNCQRCHFTCMACAGSATTCTNCSKGFVKNGTSCIRKCGKGFYVDQISRSCAPCPSDCATCEKKDSCTSCKKPKYLLKGACSENCEDLFKPLVTSTVRLVNGKNSLEGRVEILFNGAYGTVCDDNWDIKDANVVCRMLNLGNATASLKSAAFGQGTGLTLLDDVDCKGNEVSLSRCKHRGWGVEDCSHSEDAGVRCAGPDTSRSCISNEECSISSGFFRAESGGNKTCGKCSPDCATCAETAEKCTSCVPGEYLTLNNTCVQSCDSGEYVTVKNGKKICSKCNPECGGCEGIPNNCTMCTAGRYLKKNSCVSSCLPSDMILTGVPDIRLAGINRDNSTFKGRVEILHNGEWGTVCDDGWDINEARVVCRQLKFGSAIRAVKYARFGRGTGKVWMDDVACDGSENKLQSCRMLIAGFGRGNCGHSEDAGVECSGPDFSRRCASECAEGHYAVNGMCRPCSQNCKNCQITAARCTGCTKPYFLHQFENKCVTKCPVGTFGKTDTKERRCEPCDANCLTCADGVEGTMCKSCYDNFVLKGSRCVKDCGNMTLLSDVLKKQSDVPVVRLANGTNKYEGRVEVLHDGVWGTVCDDGWSRTNGHIVCKELGLGRARHIFMGSDKFGKGKGPIWMDNVQCRGFETSILQCPHNDWGITNCHSGHHEDAGVSCDNTTVEDISTNYCRQINDGPCDSDSCYSGVTCMPLFSNAVDTNPQQSVCLQCPDGTLGDGKTCIQIGSSPPVFRNAPGNRTVREGQAVQLQCISTADPRSIYSKISDWRKDGKQLTNLGSRITISLGRLTISNTRTSDSGHYSCTLVNTAGSTTSSAVVLVEGYPHIVKTTAPKARLGYSVTLECGVESYPPANITWKFNNKQLTSNDKYLISETNKSLTITKSTIADTGEYLCMAKNKLGSTDVSLYLVVGELPTISSKPKDVVGKLGTNARFTCSVDATPSAVVTWKKDGVALRNSSRFLLTSSSCSIQTVKTSDVGFYACIAVNEFGVVSAQAELAVRGKPIIEKGPERMSVLSGANITFYCRYVGYPRPSLKWLKNGKVVAESDRLKISTSGKLDIYKVTVEDSGKYTCLVKNKLGEDSHSANLVVDGFVTISRRKKTKGPLSAGAVAAIVVIFTVLVLLILGIILYKCYCSGSRPYHYTVHGGSGKFSAIKARVTSAIRNPRSVHYHGGNKDEVEFSDSKPFVDEPL